jgi:hypothetical protein
MKLIVLLAYLAPCCCTLALAEQKPLAQRTELEPDAEGKVSKVMAQTWLDSSAQRKQAQAKASGMQGKGCTTNIGAPSQTPSSNALRYGPGKAANANQTVAIRGDVINVCR